MKWSDALGPLVGAVSALLAVALGAWWQGRSAVRLVRIESEEADRVRQSQSRHEQLMMLFDDKRSSYVHLLTVASNLADARSELFGDATLPFGPEAFLAQLDQGLEQREKDASDEVDAALNMIEILAPRELYEAALQLCVVALTGRSIGGYDKRNVFIGCVRRDLGTEQTQP